MHGEGWRKEAEVRGRGRGGGVRERDTGTKVVRGRENEQVGNRGESAAAKESEERMAQVIGEQTPLRGVTCRFSPQPLRHAIIFHSHWASCAASLRAENICTQPSFRHERGR